MKDSAGQQKLMEIAWRDFLLFAIANPEARRAFTEETGITLAPATTPIDAMIDAATGFQDHALFMFAQWATTQHFGIDEAPAEFQAECRRRPLPARNQ